MSTKPPKIPVQASQSEQSDAATEARYQLLLESMGVLVWELDLVNDRFTFVSSRAEEMLGYPPADWLAAPSGLEYWQNIIHPEDRGFALRICSEATAQGQNHNFDYRAVTSDGHTKWLRDIVTVSLDTQGKAKALIGCMLDIHEQKSAEDRLKLAASVFTTSSEGIIITDSSGCIVDTNEAFTDITGYEKDDAVGEKPNILKSGRHSPSFYKELWHNLLTTGQWRGEIWNRRKDHSVYPEYLTINTIFGENREPQNFVALFSDISIQKSHEKQLEHIAHYDSLTSLPNRTLLTDRLHQAMGQSQRRRQILATVYLDLDGFKDINDQHGHDTGDLLLVEIAQKLRDSLREGDTIARIGGDEFVAVLIDLDESLAAVPILNRLLAAAAAPILREDKLLQVSASIGVTFYPQLNGDAQADQLIRQADQAMYQAKQQGKNQYCIFDIEKDNSTRGSHRLKSRIVQALEQQEFALYYQPKVNMRSGKIVGAEALARWKHPQQGVLTPDKFLPAISDQHTAITFGNWVIDSALRQIERWQALGVQVPISVNVSSQQLQETDFVDNLNQQIEDHPGVGPNMLELEILETSALQDLAQISTVMTECGNIGVNFALDDFGTGYSSLVYLKHLPATVLKIDQTFVRGMLDDTEDLAILESVINLARALQRTVIAEGVESLAHGELLLRLGCDLAQGYVISKPLPADQLVSWMNNWVPDPAWHNVPLAGPEDMRLLYAAAEHRAWVGRIEDYLKEKTTLLPHQDSASCMLIKRLQDHGHSNDDGKSAFTPVLKLHKQTHTLGAELISLQRGGQSQQAISRLGELYMLRDRLTGMLTRLIN